MSTWKYRSIVCGMVVALDWSIPALQPVAWAESNVNATIVDDIPEEVLRTEIILEGRSPLDGKPLSAEEYAILQDTIEQANQVEPTVVPKVRNLVGLLRLRKFLKTVLPFLPIK